MRKGLGKGLGQGYRNLVISDAVVHRLSRMGIKTKPVKFTTRYERGDGSKAKIDVKITKIGRAKKGTLRYKDMDSRNDQYWLEFEGKGWGSHTTEKSPKVALEKVDEFIEETKGISDMEVERLRGKIVDDYYYQMGQFQDELNRLASDPKNCGGTSILGQGLELRKHGTTVWRMPYSCYQSDMADSTVQPLMDKIQRFIDSKPELGGIKVYHNEGRMD